MKTSSNNNNIESKNQSVYVTISNGIVQDIFPDRDTAIKDMRRHVYNTLVDCCGGKVECDGETCCVVSYQGKERNDICMVVPFDPNNRDHRKAYNAQRSIWHLPELPDLSAITETEGVKVGDRVWCKHGKVMGTVTAIRIWNPDYAFKVRLDKPVTLFGQTFEETEFRRAGITKNYDRDGMIVGNAQYYAEQLKYGPASIIEYELAGVALRTESTREDVEPDSREGWGNEYRVTIHHQTGDTTETMTLSETAELLARMYQEEHGTAA